MDDDELLTRLRTLRRDIDGGRAPRELVEAYNELCETVRLCVDGVDPEVAHHDPEDRAEAAKLMIREFLDEMYPVRTLH